MATIGTVSAIFILLIANFGYTKASVLRYYSRYTGIDGLNVPASDVFKPIPGLGMTIVIPKCSVLVHYRITMKTENADVLTMLEIRKGNNKESVGSLVHSGRQAYKTATGFYMANLEGGQYTFRVYYRSPVPIRVPLNMDSDVGILQLIRFKDAHVVSDGINCSTTTNNYNNWGHIRDIEAVLNLPEDRAVLSAYQLSVDINTPGMWVTSLVVDSFFYNTATTIKGAAEFLDLHGAWARKLYAGLHYFKIYYRTPFASEFTDCTAASFENHKNLYAMMLPPSCEVAAVIRPETTFTFKNTNEWAETDVTYSLELSESKDVLVMYQYSGGIGGSHIVMRLSMNGGPLWQTPSVSGDSDYVGNFGLWVDYLYPGSYEMVLEYRSPVESVNTVSSDLEWHRYNKWMNRAMTVITC